MDMNESGDMGKRLGFDWGDLMISVVVIILVFRMASCAETIGLR